MLEDSHGVPHLEVADSSGHNSRVVGDECHRGLRDSREVQQLSDADFRLRGFILSSYNFHRGV